MRYICYSFVWFFWFIFFTSRSTLLPNTSNNLDSRNFYNAYISLSKLGTPRDLIHIRRKQVYRSPQNTRYATWWQDNLGDQTMTPTTFLLLLSNNWISTTFSSWTSAGSHHELLTVTHNIESKNEYSKSKKLKKLFSWGSRDCSSLYTRFWIWKSWLFRQKPAGKFSKDGSVMSLTLSNQTVNAYFVLE